VQKILSSLAVGGLVALTLVACSTPGGEESCVPTASGSHASAVKVSGSADAEPTVTLPPAFDASDTERLAVTEGDGATAEDGLVATVNYVVYNASTGDRIEATNYSSEGATPFLIDESQSFPGIYKALHCSSVGDRIVAVVPPVDLFGSQGLPNQDGSYAIGPTDTVVFVFDVKAVGPKPSAAPVELPTPVEWTEGVPAVDLGGDAPTVTLPDTDPPTELLLAVLEPGDGETVTDSSTVSVDYQGISWNTGEIFDQSYPRGEPSTFPVTGVIKGFAAAMVGQKVGATVVVGIPPQYAYGEGEINDQSLVGQTLVFLIQIRAVS
jgi:peptidylprolyl isomerase